MSGSVYRLDGDFANGGRIVEGRPVERDGKDAFKHLYDCFSASPRLGMYQVEFTPVNSNGHIVATRYTLMLAFPAAARAIGAVVL